ncbi:calponin homology domain-containing protein DDB_G0272472-like [Littorina saxatilis]|uniref:calponin homology domain-containing protein DDB_G0272472-like n=1 Tax=Littorina saxatilis TaxID=31220 RepID=UPI0038B56856
MAEHSDTGGNTYADYLALGEKHGLNAEALFKFAQDQVDREERIQEREAKKVAAEVEAKKVAAEVEAKKAEAEVETKRLEVEAEAKKAQSQAEAETKRLETQAEAETRRVIVAEDKRVWAETPGFKAEVRIVSGVEEDGSKEVLEGVGLCADVSHKKITEEVVLEKVVCGSSRAKAKKKLEDFPVPLKNVVTPDLSVKEEDLKSLLREDETLEEVLSVSREDEKYAVCAEKVVDVEETPGELCDGLREAYCAFKVALSLPLAPSMPRFGILHEQGVL